jgi:rhamnosyl/mannosyltransferase
LGVEDRVYFHGYIDDKKLREYYRSADLFVLPSVESSEAFGIVQLEAMAHGLPVINTDLPTGVPWVSRDRKTGLTVPPRDADALASAIQELLVDDELRESLGRNARQRVETKFTEARMLSQTLDVYAEVIG